MKDIAIATMVNTHDGNEVCTPKVKDIIMQQETYTYRIVLMFVHLLG